MRPKGYIIDVNLHSQQVVQPRLDSGQPVLIKQAATPCARHMVSTQHGSSKVILTTNMQRHTTIYTTHVKGTYQGYKTGPRP